MIRRFLIAALTLLSLTACPQATQLLSGPGGFDADKGSSSRDDKSGDESTEIDPFGKEKSPNPVNKETPPPAGGDAPVPFAREIPPPSGLDNPRGQIQGPTGGQGGDTSQQQSERMAMRAPIVAGVGPIFPKPDGQDTQVGRPRPRLRYGKDFSTILTSRAEDVSITLEGPGPIDLRFILEMPESSDGNDVNWKNLIWVPEDNGPQVRLIYIPLGKAGCEAAKTTDTIVLMTEDGSNVSFPEIHAGPGLMLFYLFDHKQILPFWSTLMENPVYLTTSDFRMGDIVSNPSGCEDPRMENSGYEFLGVLRLFKQATMMMPPRPPL